MKFDNRLSLEYDSALTEVVEADSVSEAISSVKDRIDEAEYHYTGLVVQDSTSLTTDGGSEKRVYLVASINDRDLERNP